MISIYKDGVKKAAVTQPPTFNTNEVHVCLWVCFRVGALLTRRSSHVKSHANVYLCVFV